MEHMSLRKCVYIYFLLSQTAFYCRHRSRYPINYSLCASSPTLSRSLVLPMFPRENTTQSRQQHEICKQSATAGALRCHRSRCVCCQHPSIFQPHFFPHIATFATFLFFLRKSQVKNFAALEKNKPINISTQQRHHSAIADYIRKPHRLVFPKRMVLTCI